jgi:hypothetical protein
MYLAEELQKIYNSEIKIEIRWLENGIELRIGDAIHGFVAQENVKSVADILPWFQEAIALFYPDSEYAQSLASGAKSRATRTTAQSTVAITLICPHCGTPHCWPGMETLSAFSCFHCGKPVDIGEAKIN